MEIRRVSGTQSALLIQIREAREKIETQRTKLDEFKKSNSRTDYGDAVYTAYSRLSRAKNHTQVNAASGYARRRIAQLKMALRTDSDNAPAIKAAIRQLEKAIRRGEKKKNDLTEEELLEKRRKARQELNRRRAGRFIRESGYFREAETENRHAAMLTATRLELREQARSLGAAASAAVDSAIGQYQYAAQAAPEAAAPSGGEISAQA